MTYDNQYAAQFTPAPWWQGDGEVNKYGYDPQLHIFARDPTDSDETLSLANLRIRGDCAGDDEQHPSRNVSRANARLIAAAPELYAALQAVSDMFFARPDMVATLRPMMGPAENAVCDVAAAALAKARGDNTGSGA